MVAQKNIIKKVQIGVNTPSLAHGMQLKDGLGDYFKEEILPEIDQYFFSIGTKKAETLQFETISLEISISENDSLNDLKHLITQALKEKIEKDRNTTEKENLKTRTPLQKETEAFFYFLENGTLPWWHTAEPQMWEALFGESPYNIETTKNLKKLLEKQGVRQRLVFQFDDRNLFKIVNSFLNNKRTHNWEKPISPAYRNRFWEAILRYCLDKDETGVAEKFQQIPTEYLSEALQLAKENFGLDSAEISKHIKDAAVENKLTFNTDNIQNPIPFKTEETEAQSSADGFLIQNAGLILLHPFLKMFFERMGFLSGNTIKPEKIDEAVHLLHYLATGKEQAYEYQLIFEKFLCHVPLHHPVNRHIELTKEEKLACEILLQSVLNHWSALKSKSTAILQNEFLQREGKLTISAEKQQLFIQRKTQDILLDKLPWNVHLIKIPWKEKILFVDW